MLKLIRTSLQAKLIVLVSLILIFMVSVIGAFSYVQTKKTMSADVELFSSQILRQANLNLSRYYQDNIQFFSTLRTSLDFMHWLRVDAGDSYGSFNDYRNLVNRLIEPYTSYHSEVLSIKLYNANGNEMIYRNGDPIGSLVLEPLYSAQAEFDDLKPLSPTVAVTMNDHYLVNRSGRSPTPVMTFSHRYKSDTYDGMISIDISLLPALEILNNIKLGAHGTGLIVGADGTILADPQKDRILQPLDPAIVEQLNRGKSGSFPIPQQNRMAVYESIASSDWKLLVLVPYDELAKSIYRIRNVIVGIALASLLVSLILVFLVARSITGRLKALRKTIKTTNRRHFQVRVEVKGIDEVAELAGAYNELLERIEQSIEQLTATRVVQQRAVLSAMQAQINSHFLYNALESINSMAEMAGNEAIGDTAVALANMLRYTARYRDSRVTLGEEVQHLMNYVQMIRIFYGDDIMFELNIPASLLEAPCIKTILQPFVENAVKHGYEATGEPMHIVVKAEAPVRDGYIRIRIMDNGVGMPAEKLEGLRSELADDLIVERFDGLAGIGILNVHCRLRMAYPGVSAAGIQVERSDAAGTCILLTIPYGKEIRL